MQSQPPSLPSNDVARAPSSRGLARELTAADGFAIVTGSVIGSGIFLVPGAIAVHSASLPSVLIVWLAGGLLSLCGALSLAEMGSIFPGAGGLYTYLREAYGKPVAFLYGWGLISVIQTGTIATLAAGFALYLSQLVALSPLQTKLVAFCSVLVLTGLNLMSLRQAKHLQNIGNAAKLLGLALLAAFLFWRGHASTIKANWNIHAGWSLTGFGVSLIAVLWAYEGWHVVSFTAGEFRAPQRDLPRSLTFGTLTVVGVYLILNLAFYAVLPAASITGMPSAASGAMRHAYGAGVVQLVSLLILTSILGAMNGMVLTGPRVYYAMAHDGMFFRTLGKVSGRSQVPAVAIVVQGVWASLLSVTGSFEQLYSCVVFTAWIFYGLAVAGVIVLRIRHPHVERPFRTPGYPLVPALFVIAAAVIVVSTIASTPWRAGIGASAILAGLPVYFLFRARSGRETPETFAMETD